MCLTYYITDRRQLASGHETADGLRGLSEKIKAAFLAGIDFVQVREKDLSARLLGDFVSELTRFPGKGQARLLVNERVDLARVAKADGVHLPAEGLPVSAVRSWVGQGWLVGVSCHGLEDVERAAAAGADYVLLGPVFATPSKPAGVPLGLQTFGEICRRCPIRVFALGGVDAVSAADCVRAGAAGIAGIRMFQQAQDLVPLIQALRAL